MPLHWFLNFVEHYPWPKTVHFKSMVVESRICKNIILSPFMSWNLYEWPVVTLSVCREGLVGRRLARAGMNSKGIQYLYICWHFLVIDIFKWLLEKVANSKIVSKQGYTLKKIWKKDYQNGFLHSVFYFNFPPTRKLNRIIAYVS